MTWIRDYFHLKQWNVITHPCSNFNGSLVNTLRQRQNGRHFPDDIFKWIFLNENVWISINISLKFVPRGPINNIPTLVQVMAWCRPGDKPLSEPMMIRLSTHIGVTRPQWVKLPSWMNNYTLKEIMNMIIYPCPDPTINHASKRDPRDQWVNESSIGLQVPPKK